MSREAFDRWRKQYELTELLPYGITIDHDEKELMWQAWQHQQAEIDRLKEDKRLMTLNQEKIDGLLAERGAELERLKEENKRLDSYAARINRICSGHEKEKEALQQRNSELEKENEGYKKGLFNLADSRMNLEAERDQLKKTLAVRNSGEPPGYDFSSKPLGDSDG